MESKFITQEKQRCPIILLAGGFGTRLRILDSTRPKPMVLVKNKPFLFWLIQKLISQGFNEFHISTGYLAEVIESYPWQVEFPSCFFNFHREATPMGTGGAVAAILHATPQLTTFWVVNGDTLLSDNLPLDIEEGFQKQNKLLAIFLTLQPSNIFDAKPNLAVENNFIVGESSGGTLFDGGAILCKKDVKLTDKISLPLPYSLHDLLKTACQEYRVGFHTLNGTCYDIGTPTRFFRFEEYLQRCNSDAKV